MEAIISLLANNMYVVVVARICLAVMANSLFRAITARVRIERYGGGES